MDVLVEVHDEEELERARALKSPLLGVNNRNLKTFETTLDTTRRLSKLADPGRTLVCESGIHGRDAIEEFERVGIHAFLVGESLMRAESIPDKLKELMGHGKPAAG